MRNESFFERDENEGVTSEKKRKMRNKNGKCGGMGGRIFVASCLLKLHEGGLLRMFERLYIYSVRSVVDCRDGGVGHGALCPQMNVIYADSPAGTTLY
jgi:hypothetical protein